MTERTKVTEAFCLMGKKLGLLGLSFAKGGECLKYKDIQFSVLNLPFECPS